MSGIDYEFVEIPPARCYCPICPLILREPYQVTCCGRSFCKSCIQEIQAENQPCPDCTERNFKCIQNKDLQQVINGLKVYCYHQEIGCTWKGELKQLEDHVNCDPDKNSQLVGCNYTKVKCLFCDDLYQRQDVWSHQTSKCLKRTFTCKMCNIYKSSYEDVMTNHAFECKCRPVECPNSCGANNLQHQHLEEHVSSQCPLTLVECEFRDAGCDTKIHKSDLPSHYKNNIVTHLSLLAKGLKAQCEKSLREMIADEKRITQLFFCIQPLSFKFEASPFAVHIEKPFYSHAGGYKLQLEAQLDPPIAEEPPIEADTTDRQTPLPNLVKTKSSPPFVKEQRSFAKDDYTEQLQQQAMKLKIKCTLLESDFAVQLPCKLIVTTKIIDQTNSTNDIEVKHTVNSEEAAEWKIIDFQDEHHNDYNFVCHVVHVSIA